MQRRLADGTRLLIRPLRPSDAVGLRQGFAALSAVSRYSRFLQIQPRLTEAELTYLTVIDQQNHIAWCAHDVGRKPPLGVAVARCIRLAGDPESAELAVTVIDAYQGRGVGRALVEVLLEDARDKGVRVMRGSALADNKALIALARRVGASVAPARDGLVSLSLDLAESPIRPKT